jgi:hypothetical protein
MTDLSSIIFADEGKILKGSDDPDGDYYSLIQPWKCKLGLVYVMNQSMGLYFRVILITFVSLISRKAALLRISSLVSDLADDRDLVDFVARKTIL